MPSQLALKQTCLKVGTIELESDNTFIVKVKRQVRWFLIFFTSSTLFMVSSYIGDCVDVLFVDIAWV